MKPTAAFLLIFTVLCLFSADVMSQQELGLVPVGQPQPETDIGAAIGSAIEQAKASQPRKIVVFTQIGCGPCERMKRETVADGLDIEYRQEQPAWLESFPAIWIPDVNRVDYGYKSRDQLRGILERNQPKRTASAMVMTELKIGKSVDALFDLIKPSGRDTIIPVGSGDILVPAGTQTSVSNNGGTLTLSFSGTVKPQFRIALLRLDISGVDLTREKVTIKMPGFPDLSAKVVD